MKNIHIEKAIKVVKDGGIVIYPTDTAFGIGCRIDDHSAVDRLFAVRRRPVTQATPVLVASRDMACVYFDSPSDIVRRFMHRYWPGALTIIAPCDKNVVYSPIRGGGETIGLRQPGHETALELIRGANVPIIGMSANFHGGPTPYRFDRLNSELVRLVDYVVPGECSVKMASTVVDCSVSPYRIIRQGAVRLE